MKEFFGAAAGIIFILAYIPYGKGIVSGKRKPMLSSWLIWAGLDALLATQMYMSQSLNWHMTGVAIGSFIILSLTLWKSKGEIRWGWLDTFCLIGALVGIAVWVASGTAVAGMLVTVTVMTVGTVPTYVSIWQNPEHEEAIAWHLFLFSCFCAVIAIPEWDIANALQPLVFLALNSIGVALLLLPRRK